METEDCCVVCGQPGEQEVAASVWLCLEHFLRDRVRMALGRNA